MLEQRKHGFERLRQTHNSDEVVAFADVPGVCLLTLFKEWKEDPAGNASQCGVSNFSPNQGQRRRSSQAHRGMPLKIVSMLPSLQDPRDSDY